MDIRAAELTADHLGRIVKINPEDLTLIVGRARERGTGFGRLFRQRLRRS